MDTISWEYPKQLHDEDGYPTPEALDYIKNWSIIWGIGNNDTKTGQFFGESDLTKLIEYIKLLWYYDDCVVYEDGLLEIHTLGWSGNEEIVDELKHTNLWLTRFRAQESGGHYYFVIERGKGHDWEVVKTESKW